METTEKNVTGNQIITFRLANENFGLDIRRVERIAPLEQITKVPRAPVFVSGIMNLAGRIITLVDLSRILELDEAGKHEQVIILTGEGIHIGLLIGFVSDVITLDEEAMSSGTVSFRADEKNLISTVTNIGGRIINLLDIAKLFEHITNSFVK